jgi:predicted nucleic acid-binding protein
VPTGSESVRSPAGEVTGPLYCDASALAKLFWPEPGSDELNRLLAGRDDVLVSDLGLTEVVSALARRVREGALQVGTAARVHRRLLAVAAGPAVRRVEVLAATHREAERLLLASRGRALRAVDALHLALALGAGAGTLLTYDRVMASAADEHGLAVWPEPAP